MTDPARRVRVAIIDSGVHADHPHVGGVTGGIGISEDGRTHHDYVDRLGHGTAVAAVIREKAPGAEIFCIKVFDRELAATGQALVSAIEHALDTGAQIINLSLGTANADHEVSLTRAIDKCVHAGVIVVAAGEQDGVRWLPGALPGVWSVLLDWSIPREDCRVTLRAGSTPVCHASGYPRPIPGVPPDRNLKGLSFAVANVSGLVAAALLVAPQRD
jgi:subtilisin family serine protease